MVRCRFAIGGRRGSKSWSGVLGGGAAAEEPPGASFCFEVQDPKGSFAVFVKRSRSSLRDPGGLELGQQLVVAK